MPVDGDALILLRWLAETCFAHSHPTSNMSQVTFKEWYKRLKRQQTISSNNQTHDNVITKSVSSLCFRTRYMCTQELVAPKHQLYQGFTASSTLHCCCLGRWLRTLTATMLWLEHQGLHKLSTKWSDGVYTHWAELCQAVACCQRNLWDWPDPERNGCFVCSEDRLHSLDLLCYLLIWCQKLLCLVIISRIFQSLWEDKHATCGSLGETCCSQLLPPAQ